MSRFAAKLLDIILDWIVVVAFVFAKIAANFLDRFFLLWERLFGENNPRHVEDDGEFL